MRRRSDLKEWMDDPAVDRATLATSLRFIRRVNRYLGGTRAVLWNLRQFARHDGWARGHKKNLLDVATGSADIPLAAMHWARKRGIELRVTGLDASAIMLDLAKEYLEHAGERIDLVRGDALALPFDDGSFDVVTCSMFFHHLSDDQAIAALREMLRVARRGIIVNDLLRTRLAQAGIFALTVFAEPVDRHDARLSVAKAWTRADVEQWKRAAQAPWLTYHHHVPARFTLAGLKPEPK